MKEKELFDDDLKGVLGGRYSEETSQKQEPRNGVATVAGQGCRNGAAVNAAAPGPGKYAKADPNEEVLRRTRRALLCIGIGLGAFVCQKLGLMAWAVTFPVDLVMAVLVGYNAAKAWSR